jgi:hypothetical protein
VNDTQNMKKELAKIKYVSVGTCPKCGKEFVRDCEVDTAVCQCSSVVQVNLTTAAILPAKLEQYLEGLAKQLGLTVDDMYNTLVEVGLQNIDEWLAKRQLEATQ